MKKVYLIRHALPAFPNGSKMCLGITDIPLGQQGMEQAKAMAASLPPVTAVYSSPLRRAIQTQVEDAVAEKMLEGTLTAGGTAHVVLRDGKVAIEA